MSNVDLVKQAYSHFATGNVPGVLAMFDPSIKWLECKGMPFVKDDGIYTGPEAIVTNVFIRTSISHWLAKHLNLRHIGYGFTTRCSR